MLFNVVPHNISGRTGSGPAVYLIADNWNDWFKFVTTFKVVVFDEKNERTEIGHVKIGQAGMSGKPSPDLPSNFDTLNETFFSLGQDESYYEALNALGNLKEPFLRGLRDCAYDLSIFEKNMDEEVMHQSLLRDINPSRVRGRFNRLAHGNAILTEYSFYYQFPKNDKSSTEPPKLSFSVTPDSSPPTNIHVIIGRNGVGKTRLLNSMTYALLNIPAQSKSSPGIFSHAQEALPTHEHKDFANIIFVSFSAFDAFSPIDDSLLKESKIRHAYVGLQNTTQADTPSPPKTSHELCEEFVKSVEKCHQGLRLIRWKTALETLESDPLFLEANVSKLSNADLSTNEWREEARSLFKKLSSGHGIILLTITRLVELVDEQTLVLLDEPEGHLHPPLLSAFIRALSNLLIQRNGAAIIATHSPVVLQEVPQSCVWFLSRSGANVRADRPDIETFGENVGVLTREVFGLEVAQSGFHQLIAKAVEESNGNYESVLSHFENKLGAEGRAIAQALAIAKAKEHDE